MTLQSNVAGRLQAASRLLIRTSLALFTAIVLLLLQSAFWSNRVSAWMQAIIVATALLSYFRPPYGLLALAALAPLGQVGSRTLDSQMRGAEALVLAFLAGALVRGWTLREFRTFPSTRLEIAALIFGFVVAASCLEQMWFAQVQLDFPWPFAQEVLRYGGRNYITSIRGFGMLFRAMLLLEGLALLMYAVRYARERPGFAERLVVMIVTGAVGTALLTVWLVTGELFSTGQPGARFVEFFAVRRWTAHVTDVNAAGSFFAMGMFIALGMAARKSPHRFAWMAAAVLLAGTTWMTHSRTAIAAVLLILACVAAAATVGRVIGVGRTIALTAAIAIALAVSLWQYFGPQYFGEGARSAVRIRWLFLGTTWRMLAAEPIFGLGIGQYVPWSHEFALPELLNYYQRENAHNNFAQVAGELGLSGFISFVVVLVLSVWRRDAQWRTYTPVMPVLLGVAAFILTWLGGHPLLVPEVAYPFWVALGLIAVLAAADAPVNRSAGIVATAAAVLLISVPFRVAAKSAQLDLSGVSYGISPRQLMTSRARFFVPAGEPRVAFPLRGRRATDDEPVEIDVFVDGAATGTITLTDRNWRKAAVDLPGDSNVGFHQIDLRIRPDILDNVDASRSSVEVGKWEIISKPNG
jgi:hypothetical protein